MVYLGVILVIYGSVLNKSMYVTAMWIAVINLMSHVVTLLHVSATWSVIAPAESSSFQIIWQCDIFVDCGDQSDKSRCDHRTL